jgi:hypothetical protein
MYTQQWCMSYRLVDSVRAGSEWNWFYSVAGGYTHQQLSETCRVSCQNKFANLVHLVGFIIRTNAPAFKALNWANKRTQFLLQGQPSFSVPFISKLKAQRSTIHLHRPLNTVAPADWTFRWRTYSRTLDCEQLGLRVFYKTIKNFEGILTW